MCQSGVLWWNSKRDKMYDTLGNTLFFGNKPAETYCREGCQNNMQNDDEKCPYNCSYCFTVAKKLVMHWRWQTIVAPSCALGSFKRAQSHWCAATFTPNAVLYSVDFGRLVCLDVLQLTCVSNIAWACLFSCMLIWRRHIQHWLRSSGHSSPAGVSVALQQRWSLSSICGKTRHHPLLTLAIPRGDE